MAIRKEDSYDYNINRIQVFTLTVIDAIDLINETLVGELCGQRGEQIDVTVQEQQSVEHGQDLVLTAGKLPLHPQHHVSDMLSTKQILLSGCFSFNMM